MPKYDLQQYTPPAPVANVVLRATNFGGRIEDVAMLMDSGADITLIPRSAVTALGVKNELGATYELVGFGGSKSVADSVELEFILLKRVLQGRFLVIDQY